MGKRIIALVMVMAMTLSLLSNNTITVNAASPATETVTISSFTTGDLATAVLTEHAIATEILTLSIADGVLNATDIGFIDGSLINLENLYITGSTRIHSGTDTGVFEPDDTLVAYGLEEHDYIKNVVIESAVMLGDASMSYCANLETFIGDSVETVGISCFETSTKLNAVTLPSVTWLRKDAFLNCSAMTTADYPNVTKLGSGVFNATSITSANLPLITMIPASLFDSCSSLSSVNAPLVEMIGEMAFSSCDSLATVDFPELTVIGANAFDGSGLVGGEFLNVTEVYAEAFLTCENLVSVKLPLIEEVASSTFNGCISLEYADLRSVTLVEDESFAGSNINKIRFGLTVPTIDPTAFDTTINKDTVQVPDGMRETYLADGGDGNNSDFVWHGWNVRELSNNAELDGLYISYNGTDYNLGEEDSYEVGIPHGVSEIEVWMYPGVSGTVMSLEGIVIDSGDKRTLSDLVEGSNNYTINVVSEDESVSNDIPLNIIVRSEDAGNIILDSFTTGSLEETVSIMVDSLSDIQSLTITDGILNADDFIFIDNMLPNLTELNLVDNARVHNSMETDVAVPSDFLPTAAFQNNTVIEKINIETVLVISDSAFSGCTSLVEATFPSVTSVGMMAFEGCTLLVDVYLPLTNSIGSEAFNNCTSLYIVSLPLVESVDGFAFEGCTYMMELKLPSVQFVDESAFLNCSDLRVLYFGLTPPTIQATTFDGCVRLNGIFVPTGGYNAYMDDASDGNILDSLWYTFGINPDGDDVTIDTINVDYDAGGYELWDDEDSYVLGFPGDVNEVSVEVIPYYPTQTIFFNGVEAETMTSDIQLNGDTTTVIITVLSGDETTSRDITLDIVNVHERYGEILAGREYTEEEFEDLLMYTMVPSNVKKLTITDGILNVDELELIVDWYENLELLEILDNARVHSDINNPVEPDDELSTMFALMESLVEVRLDTVKSTESDAFIECTNLETFEAASLLEVGDSTFSDCYSLTSIYLPEVTDVGCSVFAYCDSLEVLNLPKADYIDSYAFENMTNLKTVRLPKVTEISYSVFDESENVTELILPFEVPVMDEETFVGANSLTEVIVPVGAKTNYLADPNDGDTTDEQWFGMNVIERNTGAEVTSVNVSWDGGSLVQANELSAYTFEVDSDAEVVDIVVETKYRTADVTIQARNANDYTIDANVGSNVLDVTIVSDDGLVTNTFTIDVVRAEPDPSGADNGGGNNNNGGSNNDSSGTNIVPPVLSEGPIEPVTSEDILADLEATDDTGIDEPIQVAAEAIEAVEETVFDTLKESGKTLVIEGDFFEWEFDGTAEGEGDISGAFDPGISLITAEDIDTTVELGEDTAIIIQTDYHGALPFEAKLKLDIEDVPDNQPVYLYYYNEQTGKMELSCKATCVDGKAEFTLTHCSIYAVNEKLMMAEGYETLAYVGGYSDGSFKPDAMITRAEAAVIMGRLVVTGTGTTDFNDINMWAEDSIKQLADTGLMNGYSDGTFKPNNAISRAEFAVVLSRMLGIDVESTTEKGGLTDIEGHWAEDAINALRVKGVVSGYSDNTFRPNKNVTRAEAIVMINRALGREASENTSTADNGNQTVFIDMDDRHWAYQWVMNATD